MQHKRTQSEKDVAASDGNGAPFESRHSGRDGDDGDDDGDDDDGDDDENHGGDNDDDGESEDEEDASRMLFFNMPLPDELLEDGDPIHTFPRNKIRTAKYTPLSFIPKNLWFQFHNVANIFFLFVVILVVSFISSAFLIFHRLQVDNLMGAH